MQACPTPKDSIVQFKGECNMFDQNPIKTDARHNRRQERHGTPNPRCVLCLHPKIEALTVVTSDWFYKHGIEIHHIVGRNRDEQFTAPLCLNCHRQATEGLARAGVEMVSEIDDHERVAQMLDAYAAFQGQGADAMRRWADTLRKNSKGNHHNG